MTTDNPLPTPPSASASASASTSGAGAASGSQTTDSVAAAAPNATVQQTAPAAQQQQQQAQPSPAEAIEVLLQQILASNNEATLAGTLLNSLGTPDTRESILSSLMPSGADPLEALEAAQHTIGSLFILCVLVSSFHPHSYAPPAIASHLCWNAVCTGHRSAFHVLLAPFLFVILTWRCPGRSARLSSTSMSAPAVPFAYIQNFCQHLNPEVARHAPERGTSLALRVLRQCFHTDVSLCFVF